MIARSAAEAPLGVTHMVDVAEVTAFEHALRLQLTRGVAIPRRAARQKFAGSFGRANHPLGLDRVEREWLLAEDVLACLQRGDRRLDVGKWRRANNHRVEVREG